MLAARRPADESVPTLARTMTDAHGAFRLELALQRLQGIGPIRVIWAYRPGRLVATELADLTGQNAIPLVRRPRPCSRAVETDDNVVLDPEGRPLGGIRLVPVLSRVNGRGVFFTPDAWLERLTVATGADGVATFPFLPATVEPQRVRVTAPGIVPHVFPLPGRPINNPATLKLGRPARLAGSVSNDSGQPAANVPVEVWVENLYYPPSNPDGNPRPAGMPSLIHFDSGPIRTGADGSFRTPPQLMTGWSYRIVIRPEGDAPVNSESLMARTELTTVPPLRLQQRRKLVGLVHNRQGQPVGGARAFLPSGEPATTTDAQGRFLLEGTLHERTYLLVRAEGFRLQGWPAIPARQPQDRKFTLVRTSEPPDRTMTPLPAPISLEESRALARRVLDPFLRATLDKGDEWPLQDFTASTTPEQDRPCRGARASRETCPPGFPVGRRRANPCRLGTDGRRSRGSHVDRRGDRDPEESRTGLPAVGRGLAGFGARSETSSPGTRHATSPRGCGRLRSSGLRVGTDRR